MKNLILILFLLPIGLTAQNNVGIGTASPQSKVDILATGDGAELLRFSTDRPWVFKQAMSGVDTRLRLQTLVDAKWFEIVSLNGLNTAARFQLKNAYSSVMLVPDSGEVGIGLDDASGKLHVSHNSTTGFPQLRITEEGDDFGRIKFESNVNPGAFWDVAAKADTITEDSRLNFYFANALSNGDLMTIRGDGNVGIGTQFPDAKLDITGGNWNLEGGNPGDLRIGNASHNLRIGVATGGGGAGVARIFAGGGANTLFFGTDNTRRMVITNTGNVGIGLDNPGQPLQVSGDAVIGGGPSKYDVDAEALYIEGRSDTWTIGVQNETSVGASDFFIGLSSDEDGMFHIQNDGKIGIGTTNPGNKMRVVGNGNSSENVFSVSSAYSGNVNVRAIEGFSRPAVGYGVGGHFDGGSKGINVSAHGEGSTGWSIAVDATAYGTAGTRVGLLGRATGGDYNWAGYFTDGNVFVTNQLRIGTGAINGANGYKVAVAGKVIAEEVRVQLVGTWPDYVFDDGYALMPLDRLSDEIKKQGHLPGIPAADVMEEKGVDVGEMNRKLMEKVEELTLYLIDVNERLQRVEEENAQLKATPKSN